MINAINFILFSILIVSAILLFIDLIKWFYDER